MRADLAWAAQGDGPYVAPKRESGASTKRKGGKIAEDEE
jgi:hypothetical protein